MGNLFYKPTQQDIIKLINDGNIVKLTEIAPVNRWRVYFIDILSDIDPITMYKILYKHAGREFISEILYGHNNFECDMDGVYRTIHHALLLNPKIKLIPGKHVWDFARTNWGRININYFRNVREVIKLDVEVIFSGTSLMITRNDVPKLLKYNRRVGDKISSLFGILDKKCCKYAIRELVKDKMEKFPMSSYLKQNGSSMFLLILCKYTNTKILIIPDNRNRTHVNKILKTVIVYRPLHLYIRIAIRRRLKIKCADDGSILEAILSVTSLYLSKYLSRMSLYYV